METGAHTLLPARSKAQVLAVSLAVTIHTMGLRRGCGVTGGKTAPALLCRDASAPPGWAQHSALIQHQDLCPAAPTGALQGDAGKILKDTSLLSATEEHLGILEGQKEQSHGV